MAAMQCTAAAVLAAAAFLVPGAAAVGLRAASHAAMQEPDTSCGRGFDNLVQGSQDYYTDAAVKLFTHPYHRQDNATFEQELQCWFANMCTSKCGGLPSQAATRKKELTAVCQDVKQDWFPVWKMFTTDEVKYFKKEFPSKEYGEEDKLLTNSKVAAYDEKGEK